MRSELLDRRLGPFENLATNPRLKRCVSGSTVFKRNLATNPIFARAVSGTDVVRRNLCGTPKPVNVSSGGWFDGGGTTQEAEYSDLPEGFSRGVRLTRVAESSSSYLSPIFGQFGNAATAYFSPGQYASASIWVKLATASGVRPRIRLRWKDASSVTISDVLVFGESHQNWQEIGVSGLAPAGTSYAEIGVGAVQVSPSALEEGDYVIATGLLIEQRPAALPYFDGDTPDALGFTYEWEGTAGASTSVIKTASVEVWRNLFRNPLVAGTGDFGTVGSNPGTLSAETFNGVSVAQLVKATADNAGINTATYLTSTGSFQWSGRISARVLSGTASAQILMRISYTDASIDDVSTTITLTSSLQEFTQTSVVSNPAKTVANIQLQIRGSFAGTIQVTRVLVVSGTYCPPYFDGYTTPDADLMPAWTGPPNWSASILRGIVPAGRDGSNRAIGYLPASGGLRTLNTVVGFAPRQQMFRTAVSPGRKIVAKATFGGGTTTGRLYIDFLDASLVATGEGRAFSAAMSVDGSIAEVSSTAPSWAAYVQIWFASSDNSSLGTTTLWRDVAFFDSGAYSGPIFHGDTDPDDTGIVYEWEGTAHDSASVMKVGVVEVARNYAPDPRQNGTWEINVTGTSSAVKDNTYSKPGLNSMKITKVGSGDFAFVRNMGLGFITLASGQTLQYGCWVYREIGGPSTITTYRRSSVGSNNGPIAVVSLAVGWNWVTASVPYDAVNTPSAYIDIGFRSIDEGAGGSLWISGAMAMIRDTPVTESEYFDGYTSPDGDLSASWVGTPDASASVLYGADIQGLVAANASVTVRSLAGLGARCIPLVEDGVSSFTRVNFSAVVGRTYTAMVICRLTAPLTDVDNGQTLRFTIRPASSGGVTAQSPQAPNEVGDHLLAVSFIADNASLSMRMQHRGAPGSGSIYWDEILIVNGIYNGPYFDGDDDRVVWRGTPHASTSAGYPIPV